MVPGGPTQKDEEYIPGTEERAMVWLDRLPPGRTYSFWIEIKAVFGSGIQDDDQTIDASLQFIGSPTTQQQPLNADLPQVKSLVGDTCSFVDTLVTNLDKSLAKRGYSASGDTKGILRETLTATAKETAVAKVSDITKGWVTNLAASAVLGPAAPVALLALDVKGDIEACAELFKKVFGLVFLFPVDPNEKISATGIDGYLKGDETIHYTIQFENLPEATAEARRVVVTDKIDEDLILNSLELLDTSHPETLSIEVDDDTRTASFVFDGIDLPPNTEPPAGQGHIEFSMELSEGLESGTEFANQAEIVFDNQAPIVTQQVVHRIDREPPTSKPVDVPAQAASGFMLNWEGSDDGVGIWDYTVMVSKDFGPWQPWLAETEKTSARFTGEVGHIYSFEVVARDRLGHTESFNKTGEAMVTIVAGNGDPNTPGGPSDGTNTGDDGCGCNSTGESPPALEVVLVLVLVALRRNRGPLSCTSRRI
jgi:uncharacterized protein (TIGR03382 family)/uncharacterized repeat protein (TIGR01451 family)